MKLVSFYSGTDKRLGALVRDRILDVERAGAWIVEREGGVAPIFPSSMMDLLRGGEPVWQAVRDLVERMAREEVGREGILIDLESVRLAAPIPEPGKIICMGLNYHDHCREQGVPVPKVPVSFVKYTTALNDPGGEITWPEGTTDQVDFEVELALVIGKQVRGVTEEEAMACVAGYTILNDVSARDVQFSEKQWVRSKSFDTFCPMGPWLVTPDEVPDPHALGIRCRVNGALMQDSNTEEMIFRIPRIVAHLSQACTLLPGDVVSTGTPDGVGVFRKPPVFLKRGDIVEAEIDGLGVLRNPVG